MADTRDRHGTVTTVRMPRAALPRSETPLVPRDSIGGRALVAVIAIMTFLASLTTGAVILVAASASEWQSDIAREMTIQIRPRQGRDIDADVSKATALARSAPGVIDVRPFTKEQSARLLEPWLGAGLSIEELPVPRIIVLQLASGRKPDLEPLRQQLAREVPGANLDDHRGWIDRMRAMAGTAIVGGIVALVLMLVATILSVVFATRGAVATNRPVIEVLHFVGARDSYIAGQFQRHFLRLGLQGGVLGGGAAIGVFFLMQLVIGLLLGSAEGAQVGALFGSFSLGIGGYVALALEVGLIAGITAWTSRRTVHHTLKAI